MSANVFDDILSIPAIPGSDLDFRQLLETLPAGAYTCDPDGLITYFNKHAVKLWGRRPKLSDPADRYCGSFRLFASDGTPIAHDRCWMALALRDDRGYNGQEIIIERPDGSRIAALAHANPIRDRDGKIVGCVNVLVDIEERKRAEVALAEAARQKDEFLATLAHELRNPLSPILNAVELLQGSNRTDTDVVWAQDVLARQTRHMARLIDDLMDVSRITRGKLTLRREIVPLGSVIMAAVETSQPLIQKHRHTLTIEGASEPLALRADRVRLSQVISNLLNNAAKYTEPGGDIRLASRRDGDDVVIEVTDDGIGFTDDVRNSLFDMFCQAEQSEARSREGLGIGLTLARRLVELHGGTIDAHSDGPGTGSTFTVRLPLSRRAAPAPSSDDEQTEKLSPLRILVVDDNSDAATALSVLLTRRGNTVQTAPDGAEALRAAETFRPDVILLDIGLPQIDGYEVARRVRQQPWGASMSLIAVTGWGQDSDRDHAREAGFDEHMVKPIDMPRLMQIVSKIARGKSVSAKRPG